MLERIGLFVELAGAWCCRRGWHRYGLGAWRPIPVAGEAFVGLYRSCLRCGADQVARRDRAE